MRAIGTRLFIIVNDLVLFALAIISWVIAVIWSYPTWPSIRYRYSSSSSSAAAELTKIPHHIFYIPVYTGTVVLRYLVPMYMNMNSHLLSLLLPIVTPVCNTNITKYLTGTHPSSDLPHPSMIQLFTASHRLTLHMTIIISAYCIDHNLR